MIREKDVIRVKVPYPTINDGLALSPHMYICKQSNADQYEYVKCQTLKPYMLTKGTMQHFHDEQPDPLRNPFRRTTRIDCDKIFSTYLVKYDDALKTYPRSDVCDDLFRLVLQELATDGYDCIQVDEGKLVLLNELISFI